MSTMRTCRKCAATHPLLSFPKYGPNGKRRYECQSCVKHRMAIYANERKLRAPLRVPSSAPAKLQPPNFNLLYGTGTRCWCCRRNSAGQMLCRTCRGAA